MSRAPVVTAAWAALLLALSVVLWGVFTPPDPFSYALPAAAVALAALIAVIARRRRPTPPGANDVVAVSVPTGVTAVGLSLTLLGLAVGPWLYFIGAGVILLGLFGLAREGGS